MAEETQLPQEAQATPETSTESTMPVVESATPSTVDNSSDEAYIDPEAVKHAHQLFKKDGYNGSLNDFQKLIATDKEALSHAHQLFKMDGYTGSLNDFQGLVIEKKKGTSQSSGANSQKGSTTNQGGNQFSSGIDTLSTQPGSGGSYGKVESIGLDTLENKKPIVPKVVKPKKQDTMDINFDQFDMDRLIDFDNNKQVLYAPSTLGYVLGKYQGVEKTKNGLEQKFNQWLDVNYKTAISKTKNAILNQDDLNDIESDYQEAESGGGLWDGIKVGFTKTMNAIGDELYTSLGVSDSEGNPIFDMDVPHPLDDFRKEVQDEADLNSEALSPEEFNKRVKDKYIAKQKAERLQSKINDAKEDLTPGEQYALGKHKAMDYVDLSEKNKQTVQNFYHAGALVKQLADEKHDIENEYNSIIKSGGQPTQELIDRYKDINDKIASNLTIVKTYQNEIETNDKNIRTFQQEASAWTSTNNELTEITKRVQSFGNTFMSGQAELASKTTDKALDLFTGDGSFQKANEKRSEEYAKAAEDIKGGREGLIKGVKLGGVTKTMGFHSINDYINTLTEVIGDNLGMTAMLATGSPIALGAMAGESTGGKMREMRNENEAFKQAKDKAVQGGSQEFEFGGQTYNTKQWKDKDLHSSTSTYLAPIAWGLVTLAPMAKQLKYFKGEARIINSLESPELLKKSIGDKFKSYVGHSLDLAKDMKIMTIGQTAIDYMSGKKVDWYEAAANLEPVRDAFILHGLNSQVANVMGQTARPYMTNEEARVIDSNAKVMLDLNQRINSGKLPEAEKNILKKQLDKLSEESQQHIDNVLDRMGDMSKEDYMKVIDLARKSSEIRQEAASVNNSKLNKTEKQSYLDKLAKEYSSNESKLRSLKDNYTKRTDGFFGLNDREKIKKLDEAAQQLKSEAQSRGDKTFNFTNRDIKIRASQNYSNENSPKGGSSTEGTGGTTTTSTGSTTTTSTGGTAEGTKTADLKAGETKGTLVNQEVVKSDEGNINLNQNKLPTPDEVANARTETPTEKPKEPSIVVHATVDAKGFSLNNSSEGTPTENIETPKDPRMGFKDKNQAEEFNSGKSVITKNEIAESGDKNISVASPITDALGRSGGSVYDFEIPKGNKATAEGIKDIIDKTNSNSINEGLKGQEIVDQTVKNVKEYIDSNKPTEEAVTPTEEVVTPTEEVKPNTIISDKEAEVKKLREQEQNEYKDVDPSDKAKLGEIYNKYDKLISPLLKDIEANKTTEPTPTKTRKQPKETLEGTPTEEAPKQEKEKEIVSLPDNEKDLHALLLDMQEKGVIKIKEC